MLEEAGDTVEQTAAHTHASGLSAAVLFLQRCFCTFKEHVCTPAAALRITGCSFLLSFCPSCLMLHTQKHSLPGGLWQSLYETIIHTGISNPVCATATEMFSQYNKTIS